MTRKSPRPGVWLISSGDYSSYRVHAAFATEELVKEVCDAANTGNEWSDYQVEYRELHTAMPERKILYGMRVQRGYTDTTWSEVESWQQVVWPWDYEYPTTARPRVRATGSHKPGHGWSEVSASGSDLAAVRQAFSDRWAQVKAQEEGL